MTNAIAKKPYKQADEKPNALKLFVIYENDLNQYHVSIKNFMRFKLAMDHVSMGRSFRQTSDATQHARYHTKTVKMTGMNEMIFGQYERILVSAYLQDISDIIGDAFVWASSFAFHASTH